jgi:hypothetical protein
MSSSAASCCTCCHEASSASVTSASSQTANERSCCRSASACSAVLPIRSRRQPQTQKPSRLRCFPSARSAAEPCTSSSGSPRLNCFLAPHCNRIGAPHEHATPASNPSHATACPPRLRPKPHPPFGSRVTTLPSAPVGAHRTQPRPHSQSAQRLRKAPLKGFLTN